MSTYHPKAGDITRKWYVIDATDVVLGRLAVTAADLLRGKRKPCHHHQRRQGACLVQQAGT